jgi:hypothetical protein
MGVTLGKVGRRLLPCRCGQENPEGSSFCNACGAPLAEPAAEVPRRAHVHRRPRPAPDGGHAWIAGDVSLSDFRLIDDPT